MYLVILHLCERQQQNVARVSVCEYINKLEFTSHALRLAFVLWGIIMQRHTAA